MKAVTLVKHALLAMTLLLSREAHADFERFALIIGNNAPPAGHEDTLDTLHFADDDAIRYYLFFRQMTDHVRLLTVPDQRTQERYPDVVGIAKPPSLENLKKSVSQLGAEIEAAKDAGAETVIYVVFSGHGALEEDGSVYLSLMGGKLTRALLYKEIILRLRSDYQHVIVDACYAEGIVSMRGAFDREVDGRPVDITKQEIRSVLSGDVPTGYSGLGILVSSSESEESHEWSEIEAGVFTHEILSGLAGPADINLDGKIEYSELASFVSAANRKISDPRGRVSIVAHPPKRNIGVPLVDFSSLKRVSLLYGDPTELGHFSIELGNGMRYLDANLGGTKSSHIVLPQVSRAYLRSDSQEAQLLLSTPKLLRISSLRLSARDLDSKGSVAQSFRKGLFETQFNKAYYLGFVDNNRYVEVDFSPPSVSLSEKMALSEDRPFNVRKAVSIAFFTLAGISAASAIVFGALTLSAKNDYESTDLQRESKEANGRYSTFGTAAWVSVGVLPVGLLVGFLVWPNDN